MKNLAIVIVCALGLFAISANLENETRIAVIDLDLVLENMEEWHDAESKLELLRIKKLEALPRDIKDMRAKMKELKKESQDSGKLPKDYKMMKRKNRDYERKISIEMRTMEEEIYGPILKRVSNIASELALKEGYDYVVNKNRTDGLPILLTTDSTYNITDKVIQVLAVEARNK